MIANLAGFDLGAVIIVALIVLVGGTQLPKIARNIGLAGKEFRKAQDEAERDNANKQPAPSLAPPPPTPVGPAPATPPQAAVTPPHRPEDSVVLTRSELDALLKAREEQAKGEAAGPAESN